MRDAEMRALGGRHGEKVLSIVADLARRRSNDAGDGLEQGRLAGAVRADDEDDPLDQRELEPLIRPVVPKRYCVNNQALSS